MSTAADKAILKKFTDKLQLRFDNVQRAWHHIRRKIPPNGAIQADKVRSLSAHLLDYCAQPHTHHATVLLPCALALIRSPTVGFRSPQHPGVHLGSSTR